MVSIPLVEVTRGALVECLHRGNIAVTDSNGVLLAAAGDPQAVTYMRSAAKPIQALNVITSGAAARYHLTDAELAVICSSHYAEPHHLKAVRDILRKIGLTADHILGGTVTSLNPAYALKLAASRTVLSPIYSDCSGKHAGMLAVCVHKGWPVETYLDHDHPCQQEILRLIAAVCRVREADIIVGIDGCSAPVHALPLTAMARGFAAMASPGPLPDDLRRPAERIFAAMNAHPEMIAGSGGFCSDLIRATGGRLIGKIGAEGVYCVGLRQEGTGIAVKVESGSMAVLPPVVIGALEQLGFLSPGELRELERYRIMPNLNDRKRPVGSVRPVFTLQTDVGASRWT
ncbi:asparaginase [bacterium]|nr:asparaginase [bacterium]